MKTRICPLCDQPMKKTHHCDYCHSFIWKPLYLDIHYKTGSESEDDCSYAQKAHEYEYHENGSITMMPSKNVRKNKKFRGVQEIEFRGRGTSERSEDYSTTTPDDEENFRRKGGCLKKIVWIIFILVIISTIYEVIWSIVSTIDFENGGTYEYFTNAEEIINPSTDEREYTDEEVLAMGEECNSFTHMVMTSPEFIASFEEQLREQGKTELSDNYDDASYNRSYAYGDNINTYFNSSRMYFMIDGNAYYSIEWDTYSERLHTLAFEAEDSHAADVYFNITMESLGLHSERYLDEFQKQRSIAEDKGYIFYDIDELEVYISYYDSDAASESTYYVSIEQKD